MTTELTPLASDSYGSVAAVQGYVLALRFGATTNPSLADVATMLAEQTAIIDARLASGGYVVPVADAGARSLLDSIAVRFVAAGVIERLVLGKSPDAAKVESAATWRREAEALLAGIVDGTTPLAGAAKSGSSARSGGAGIATGRESAFPHSNRDAFIRAHGAETANAGAGASGLTFDGDR